MAGFRISHPAQQWTDDQGNIIDGGSLVFSDSGSSTPRNVFSDEAATVSLGATLAIGADGRTADFFLSGEYRVRLLDADDNQLWLRDNVRDVAGGGIVPLDPADGSEGAFYRTDGVDAYWDPDVLELPDPTGSGGYFLVANADGDGYELQAPAAVDDSSEAAVSTGASGYLWINGILDQWGTDTAPTAGALSTSKAVTFGVAFDSAPYHVSIEPAISSGVTSNSPSGKPCTHYSSPTTTGFTAGFFVGEENTGGTDTITSTIPFTWRAVGPKATAPA